MRYLWQIPKSEKRMNRIYLLFSFALTLSSLSIIAQDTEQKSPQEKAREYTREGDFRNAEVVLSNALKTDPQNIELLNDLAFNYYLEKDYAKGLMAQKAVVDGANADVRSYQVLALLYKAIEDSKECE